MSKAIKVMFYVYGLYSPVYKKIYIGFTSDLENRIFLHNNPINKGFTSRFRPWIIIYTEEVPDKATAMKREKQLKSAKGRLFIKTFIPADNYSSPKLP
jgi:putative endonuclease